MYTQLGLQQSDCPRRTVEAVAQARLRRCWQYQRRSEREKRQHAHNEVCNKWCSESSRKLRVRGSARRWIRGLVKHSAQIVGEEECTDRQRWQTHWWGALISCASWEHDARCDARRCASPRGVPTQTTKSSQWHQPHLSMAAPHWHSESRTWHSPAHPRHSHQQPTTLHVQQFNGVGPGPHPGALDRERSCLRHIRYPQHPGPCSPPTRAPVHSARDASPRVVHLQARAGSVYFGGAAASRGGRGAAELACERE